MSSKGRTLWKLIDGFRRLYLLAIAAQAVATLLMYLVPLVTRATIDAAMADVAMADVDGPADTTQAAAVYPLPASWATGDELASRLWIAAAAITALALCSGLFQYFKGRWTAQASEGIVRRLRDLLYDHLQHLPCRYHDHAETGDLVQRCTSDVETVRHFLALQVVEIGRAVLLLLTVIPIMLLLHPRMAAVSLAGTPLIAAFSIFFFLKVKPSFLRMDEAEGRMTTVLQENLTGIRVVRAFARQEFECEKFAAANGDYRDRHYWLICLLAIYWPISDVMVLGQQAAVLLVGASWISSGQLSVGTLVAFLLFVNIFIWPLRQLGRILTDLGKALVAVGRIEEILAVPREADAGTAAATEGTIEVATELAVGGASPRDEQPPPPLEGGISFRHVNFQYDSEPVLCDVSFDVQPGQTLAIVGPSGAGKLTIVNLLLRLYDGATGQILLDGHDAQRLPRQWLRQQISVVMQEPFLYSKTLRENIALGRHEAREQELVEAAHTAAIHEAIVGFEQGYETLVGERGVTLSGGQRQRVALARALLQRPAILILDDALSAVDTKTETLILRALFQRRGAHTTLVITHRLSTLRQADQVLVLDQGRVQQLGTPQSLLSTDGTFRRLWESQAS